ncbi:MAG: inositol monophosphatase family protein [Verrucomicrobia bacterium]|nr:inositol monophosphatase family protein [Verrucomicrobiota bacterium]
MNEKQLKKALDCAAAASRDVGKMLRSNLNRVKRVNQSYRHDIKLELDVRSQNQIERALERSFPGIAILGEEGVVGDQESAERWVVDPIDGTVNFAFGIPHACISIALQIRTGTESASKRVSGPDAYETVVGVVYDPFCDEMWTAIRGGAARMNGSIIRASSRARLADSIVSIGVSKFPRTIKQMLPVFEYLMRRARKVRIMGAAALGLVYVASGRFDAYLEPRIRLWDIAAGGLILERAGGEFWRERMSGKHAYRVIANNGWLRKKLPAINSEA